MNCVPYKYCFNLPTTHSLAKHSNSTVAYLVSLTYNFLLKYIIGKYLPSYSCKSTVPIPVPDASVQTINGFFKSGNLKLGAPEISCLSVSNIVVV